MKKRAKKSNKLQFVFIVTAGILVLTAVLFSVLSAVTETGGSNVSSEPASSYEPPYSSDISYPDESEIEDPEMGSSDIASIDFGSRIPRPSIKNPEPYSFKPKYAIIYEPAADYIHFEKNINKQIAPASTAKLFSALVAAEYLDPEALITVGEERYLVERDASILGLSVGDTLTARELILALMVSSGGDAAYTLAVSVAKAADTEGLITDPAAQIEYFMTLVNEYAAQHGFDDCHFVTPDGYDADGQYVTVYSLARVAAMAMENELVREAITTRAYTFTFTTTGKTKTAYNTNKLLRDTSSYYSPYVSGIKTGTTSDAGNCLVADCYINGRYFIIITMKQRSDEFRYKDILSMIEICKDLPIIEIPEEPDNSSDLPSDSSGDNSSDIPSDNSSDISSDTSSEVFSDVTSSEAFGESGEETSSDALSDTSSETSSETDENNTSVAV